MGWSGGTGEINALWHSAHSSAPQCVIWEQSIKYMLYLNTGRIIGWGSNDWGLRMKPHVKTEMGAGSYLSE